MLTWTLDELGKYKSNPLKFNDVINVSEEIKQRNTGIKKIDPVKVSGYLVNRTESIEVVFHINTKMIVPSTRSLADVEVDIDEDFDEVYVVTEAYYQQDDLDSDESKTIIELDGNRLDLLPAIVDNVILSIPNVVLTNDELKNNVMPSGDNWQVMSENEYHSYKNRRPQNPQAQDELSKLKSILSEENQED